MDNLIRQEIAGIINKIQRNDAPQYFGDEGEMLTQETSMHTFAIVDSLNNPQIITNFDCGTANYINGKNNDTYTLKFISYDDYLHRFVYDDGKGNRQKSRLRDGIKVADYIVYDTSQEKKYVIIHELSTEASEKKIRVARKQLSDTLNQLYKSEEIARFLDSFENKICYLSARDGRGVQTGGLADGFMTVYAILPEPSKFNFGQIGTHHFEAYESSVVKLDK